jgi:hypothetical protein
VRCRNIRRRGAPGLSSVEAPWARFVVRVAGSWIDAAGVLMLGSGCLKPGYQNTARWYGCKRATAPRSTESAADAKVWLPNDEIEVEK